MMSPRIKFYKSSAKGAILRNVMLKRIILANAKLDLLFFGQVTRKIQALCECVKPPNKFKELA